MPKETVVTLDSDEGYTVSLTALSDLVGQPFFDLIMAKAPEVVIFRIAKAADHYNKARLLSGVDEAMGAIRLIAAEEELVVAIFKWLERNSEDYPDVGLMLRQYKQHRVKLSFYPTLCQFIFAMEHMAEGVTLPGLEAHIKWKPDLIVADGKVLLRLLNEEGKEIIRNSPLMISVNRSGIAPAEIVESLLSQFRESIGDKDIKTYVEERAVFRDRLLYAYDDAATYTMDETLDQLFGIFDLTLRRLLLTLAVLMSEPPPSKEWGVLPQFFALYHRVLLECGFGKPAPTGLGRVPDTHEEIEFIGV